MPANAVARAASCPPAKPPLAALVTVEQAVRVAWAKTWTPKLGPATIICWGIFPSGLLRHPVLTAVVRP
jgi:hypothetical protein